jgi:multiple sugar transport system substrate-binding protein
LRSAAGQMIENTVKSVRRKQTVDDKYISKLYDEIKSLYRLDAISVDESSDGKKELGKLPFESKLLIGIICFIWLFLAIYTIYSKVKAKKQVT